VVSPSSKARDEREKKRAYDLLGVQEYAIFTPYPRKPSTLVGWRRGESGRFEPWLADADGRLWSTALDLYILVRGERVMAQTAEGVRLLTPEEQAAGRREAEAALQRETRARQAAEEEVARLRHALERRDDA